MVLTILTLLGLLHGLVLLPVLLSILGPPPEVTTPSCSQPRGLGGTEPRQKTLSDQQTGLNSQGPLPMKYHQLKLAASPFAQTSCPSPSALLTSSWDPP